mmetsp:Transcript_117779/g.366969  ORF Transcript_117779/g.366969 Transcript_117779/m.366969 type:complete len:403 (+) Transcript_117779:52-1260(+)
MGFDAVQAFFDGLHVFFRWVFTTLFMGPAMFLVALVIMLQWHVRKAFPDAQFLQPVRNLLGRPSTRMRRVGLNIFILQIYFDPGMPEFIQCRKFSSAILAILLETIVLRYGIRRLASKLLTEEQAGEPLWSPLLELQADEPPDPDPDPRWDDDPDAEPGGDLTESMYMDLTVGFHSVLPVFLVQMALMAFYINQLNDPKSDTKDAKNVRFGYWIVGVMIQLFAGEQQLGSPYCRKFWKQVLTSDKQSPVYHVSERIVKVYDVLPLPYGKVWRARSWMDFVMNSMARDLLMYTFPIMLCVEDPLDFVKDCCAVFFITTLDDTGFEKAKTIPQMMVRLKFNIFYDHMKANNETTIPLRFTKEEAESAKFDPTVWDQFENQRGFVSFLMPDVKVLDHMMENIEPE